jgi:hypothetical protein
MEYLIKYLGAGQIYKYPKNPAVSLTIVKFSDIINTIIPFFPLLSCGPAGHRVASQPLGCPNVAPIKGAT